MFFNFCVKTLFFWLTTKSSFRKKKKRETALIISVRDDDVLQCQSLDHMIKLSKAYVKVTMLDPRDPLKVKYIGPISLSQGLTPHHQDPDDAPKSPPNSPNSSTRKVPSLPKPAAILSSQCFCAYSLLHFWV